MKNNVFLHSYLVLTDKKIKVFDDVCTKSNTLDLNIKKRKKIEGLLTNKKYILAKIRI